MSRWDNRRFAGSGFAQSMLLHGEPLLSSGPRTERLPAIRIVGPVSSPDLRGQITVWYQHPDRSHVRWKHSSAQARVGLATVIRAVQSIDPGRPDAESESDEAGRERESWIRAAQRIREDPEELASGWWWREVENWTFDDGTSEVAFVERRVARRVGRRVEWVFQAMPLMGLALIADHHDEIATAYARAVRDAPGRLLEKRRRRLRRNTEFLGRDT